MIEVGNYIINQVRKVWWLHLLHLMQLYYSCQKWCNEQPHHIFSYGPKLNQKYLECTNDRVFSDIPKFHHSILTTAEQFVRIVCKAQTHNWFIVCLKTVNYFRAIENSDHSIFKGSCNYRVIWHDSE